MFTRVSITQSKLIEKWTDPKISSIKTEIQLAAFLQEVGKIIFSMIIAEKNLTSVFQEQVSYSSDISIAEKAIFGVSSSEVTALIFSHWKFHQNMIDYIRHSDDPECTDI